MSGQVSEAGDGRGAVRRLSMGGYWCVLGAATVAFLLLTRGERWHPLEIWGAILWSYALIPLLVAVPAWARDRWDVRGFIADTISIASVKFAVTYVLMTLAWAIAGPEFSAPLAPVAGAQPAPPSPPEPTRLPPERLGRVWGEVRDASGRPLDGVIVHVASGLEGIVYRPPPQPLVLHGGPAGTRPSPAWLQAHQELILRSSDGRLHTCRGSDRSGRQLFNFPIIARERPLPRVVPRGLGLVRLECTVHPTEPSSALLVLSHPFVTRTAGGGAFSWEGVPAGELELAARRGAGPGVRRSVRLEAQRGVRVVLELPD